MRSIILVHYGELALKRGNRRLFEERLADNIRAAAATIGRVSVRRLFGRMIVDPKELPVTTVLSRLSTVFGIAWFGRGFETEMTWEDVLGAVDEVLPQEGIRTFGVRAKKADERWLRSRSATERDVGAHIVATRGWQVDLEAPDLWVRIEVANGRAIVSGERLPGSRGLPVGTGGRAMALLSGGIDSPVAAWMMMSRGLHLDLAHFHSAPYTDRKSQDKVRELAERLLAFQPHLKLHMIPFAPLQQEIVQKAPQEWRILLYRRFMMRVAARLARGGKARALITGESLGQVASQTLTNMRTVEDASPLPVLRPLVGVDKETIIAWAKRAGTFDISIQPHDDCCSFLMPRGPLTRSHPREAALVEEALDVQRLVEECAARVETVDLGGDKTQDASSVH